MISAHIGHFLVLAAIAFFPFLEAVQELVSSIVLQNRQSFASALIVCPQFGHCLVSEAGTATGT
jgi:hypothetical protein